MKNISDIWLSFQLKLPILSAKIENPTTTFQPRTPTFLAESLLRT